MDRQTENFFKAVDGCTVLIICPWIWSSFQTPLFKYSIDRKISFTYSLNPGFCLEPKAVSPVSFQQGELRSKRDRRLPVFNMMVAGSTNRCMHEWSDTSFICCVTFTARAACATSRKHHLVNEVQRDAVCEAAQSHLRFFLQRIKTLRWSPDDFTEGSLRDKAPSWGRLPFVSVIQLQTLGHMDKHWAVPTLLPLQSWWSD